MYIKQRGIESLRKYQYRGVDLSYFSKYLFQPFWQRFVLIFPLWIAPNLITLTGFAFLIVSCSLSYIYSSDLVTPSPSWLFILHGLLLFLYQTFDAVDGKQARRTNSSSPLGELFDHGCDALACTVEALTLGSMLLAGKKVVLFWAIGTCAFFFATWETFYTHTLLLNVVNGPTEGLLMIYLGHFFTSIVGPEWWTLDFREALFLPPFFSFIKKLPMNDVMLWLFFVMALIPTNISSILSVREVVAKGKRGSMANAYLLLVPYSSLIAFTIAWAYFSPSDIAKLYPYAFLISNGFGFAYLVGRIILAHLTNESENLFFNMCKPLLFLPLATVNAFVAFYFNIPIVIDEKLLLLLHFIYTTILYSHFVWKVIHEICSILNIYCLRIKRHNSTD